MARTRTNAVHTPSSPSTKVPVSTGHGPAVVSPKPTSTVSPIIPSALATIVSIVSNAVQPIPTTPASTSSSRRASGVKPLPQIGNLAPSLTQRHRDNEGSESLLSTGIVKRKAVVTPASSAAGLDPGFGSISSPTKSLVSRRANTLLQIASVTQRPAVSVNALSLNANKGTDNSFKTTTSHGANKFPATEPLGVILAKITSFEGYISKYSSTNAATANPVAEALSTILDEYLSVTSWCSGHNTAGAPLSVQSYCGPRATPNTRRDAVPTTTVSDLHYTETTLITQIVYITNVVAHTSTTSLSTTDSTHSSHSPQPSQLSSPRSTWRKYLNRRKDYLAAWGVTNSHHPAEIGTNILSLPPHQWDCVRRPHSCTTILSLIGVLCGIPLGIVLFILLRTWWRCCRKARVEKKFEEMRNPGHDAAMQRASLNKLMAKFGGLPDARASKTKKGRRTSDATIELGPGLKY